MSAKRFAEIDLVRGIAVVMMLVYHLAWDLNYFGHYRANLTTGNWFLFQRLTATLFVFVVGISLWLSYTLRGHRHFTPYLLRGGQLLGWGCLITLVTRLFLQEGTVLFGILHLIGFTVILAYPFLRLGSANLLTVFLFFAAGSYLARSPVSLPFLSWLGFKPPPPVYMVDFFPIYPWFGIALAGVAAGSFLYPNGRRRLPVPSLSLRPLWWLELLGRRSLSIYLLHQPVFFGLLFLLKAFSQLVAYAQGN